MTDQTTLPNPVHIAVVLDRSGSMRAIANDMVGGFNAYLDQQRAEAGEARITLVQFDSQDPFEVLIDATDLASTPDLDPAAYQPRGVTPLYDAVGTMIERLTDRAAIRRTASLAAEDVVVVIVTDGHENASHIHTRDTVFALIDMRQRDGWTFVFLGANQDAYAAGAAMSIPGGSTSDWEHSREGVEAMWTSVGHATVQYRGKTSPQRHGSTAEYLRRREEAMGSDHSDPNPPEGGDIG